MAEKDMRMALLLDFYGDILPEQQLNMMSLYYNEDYSLSEIAEEIGITRQGVRDAVRRAEDTLNGWEEKLHIAERFLEQKTAIAQVTVLAEALRGRCEEKGQEELAELCEGVIAEINEICF